MSKVQHHLGERLGRASASPLSASELRDFEYIVRRMGQALSLVHSLLMTRLIDERDSALAERLNDELKPLVDMLLRFEVRDATPR